MLTALAFATAHWRKLAALAVVLAAFAAGRYTARKPDVSVKTQVVTDTHTQTAQQSQVQRDTTKHEDKVTKVDRVERHADGTTVETKTEVDDVTGVDSRSLANTVKATDTVTHQTETQTITVRSAAPRWSAGFGVGTTLTPRLPFFGAPFGIGEVSYRLGGPFWLTGYLSSPFTTFKPEVGVIAGVEF